MRIISTLVLSWFFSATIVVSAVAEDEYFLDQFAPTKEERAGWEEARQAYIRFASTAEYLSREVSSQDKKVRGELEEACIYNFQDCQSYIRTNRSSILRALPDNPLYWERYWQILEVNPHTFLGKNDNPDYQRLIPATYWWFYRDLAEDGRLNIENALALQNGLNHWMQSHHTLIGRMMTIAMRSIALNQISYAMAQASRDRDEDALAALIHATKPISLNNVSFGRMFWMEREFVMSHWDDFESNPEWQSAEFDSLMLDAPPDIDPEVVRRFAADPLSLVKADSDILAKHYVAESAKPWSRYWSEGIRTIDENEFEVKFLYAISAPAYNPYIATDRYSGFMHNLFAAAADIYTGRASPGLPGRPAPAHWRWEWQEGPYPQICLVSETVHPSTQQGVAGAPEQMCLEYYDEKAVQVLVRG